MLNYVVYCNALLNNRQTKLTSTSTNLGHRLVNRVRRRKHVTPILQSLHWLPIRMRNTFTIEDPAWRSPRLLQQCDSSQSADV